VDGFPRDHARAPNDPPVRGGDSAERLHARKEAAVARLQAEAKKVQARLDAMYEDKLDGTITEDLWRRKNEEWRKRQMEALAAVERHQGANHLYLDEGARILDLARRAFELWEKQPREGRRKLLETLLSNCTFDGGNLSAAHRKPFCWLAEGSSRPNWLPARGAVRIASSGACPAEGRELVEGCAEPVAPVAAHIAGRDALSRSARGTSSEG